MLADLAPTAVLARGIPFAAVGAHGAHSLSPLAIAGAEARALFIWVANSPAAYATFLPEHIKPCTSQQAPEQKLWGVYLHRVHLKVASVC